MPREIPPEYYDDGFWYVIVPELSDGLLSPNVPGSGVCAWYADIGGATYCAIRVPEALSGIPMQSVSVAEVLTAAGADVKPYARVLGK